jgi:AcrR family transcriptional regulator
MLRPSKPPTLRGQQTRKHLLAGAEQVFSERGFERASISEITRRAGVAVGSFYVYFPTKHAIFVELIEHLGRALRKRVFEKTQGLSGRLAIERAGMLAFLEFVREHRGMYRIMRQAEFVDEGVFRRYYQSIADAYAHGLTDAMGKGEVSKGDAEVMAWSMMGVLDFLGMRFVLWSETDDLDRVVDAAMKFVGRGLERRAG